MSCLGREAYETSIAGDQPRGSHCRAAGFAAHPAVEEQGSGLFAAGDPVGPGHGRRGVLGATPPRTTSFLRSGKRRPLCRSNPKRPHEPKTPRVAELLRNAIEWQASLMSGGVSNHEAIACPEGLSKALVIQILGLFRPRAASCRRPGRWDARRSANVSSVRSRCSMISSSNSKVAENHG